MSATRKVLDLYESSYPNPWERWDEAPIEDKKAWLLGILDDLGTVAGKSLSKEDAAEYKKLVPKIAKAKSDQVWPMVQPYFQSAFKDARAFISAF